MLTLAALVYGVVAGLVLGTFAPDTSPWNGLLEGRSVAVASFLLIVVLAPLAEIVPDARIAGARVADLLARLGLGGAQPLGPLPPD